MIPVDCSVHENAFFDSKTDFVLIYQILDFHANFLSTLLSMGQPKSQSDHKKVDVGTPPSKKLRTKIRH